MASLHKKFKTKASITEMRHFIDTKLLLNPALKPMIDTAQWNGDSLFITSKMGKGTITLFENLVEVNFDLNFIGSMAKNSIEAALDKEFKQLNP